MFRWLCFFSSLLCATVSYADSFTANVTGGTLKSNISMTIKASCSASVNDVAFGQQTAGAIKDGTVAAKQMIIGIECDTTLATYKISFTPQDGLSNVTTGIIKTSNNSSVGYQLQWADNTVGTSGSAVTMSGADITPATAATAASFNIPINVKPVALGTTVSPGAANTALNISLKFN